MAHLRVALLSGLAAVIDGRAVARFRSARTRALLALLAAAPGRAYPRERVAGILWPDQPEATALHNLSQTLLQLRHALNDASDGTSFIIASRQAIWLNLAACSVDVAEMEAHFAAARAAAAAHDLDAYVRELEHAIALYSGSFLIDFSMRGSDLFEDWMLFTRMRLHQQALDILERLARHYAQMGDYLAAAAWARRSIELDPLREENHRQLMRMLMLSGQHGAALAQYETLRRSLSTELGALPAPETTALYAQIHAGEPASAAANVQPEAHPASPWQGLSEPPDPGSFYGRSAEMAALQRWVADERCRVVVILGIGGVGKTTLAAQAAEALRDGFDRVVWRSLLNAPLLEETLQACLRALAPQALARLPASLDARLDLLLNLLREQRCLLVLDNLESILEAGERAGTYRQGYSEYGQLLTRVGSSRHSSCVVVTSRERPLGLERLERAAAPVRTLLLTGIDPASGAAIMRERGIAEEDGRLAELVGRYSGNPLALALVSAAIRDLFGGNVAAFLRGETTIFDDVRDVLDQQWQRLAPLERELLLWLAVAREPATLAELHARLVTAPPLGEVVAALRSLQHRSLLTVQGGAFELQHVIIEYLTDHLVAQAVSELVAAAPESLNRHALLQTRAKEYVRQSQARLILTPVAQRLRARLGEPAIEALFARVLNQLRATPRTPGYAAGNILNLLLQLDIDPRGYDFSQLCVWQGYVRGDPLPGVSFARADLTGSVFTDSFRAMHSVAWSPDGSLLATGASDGAVFIWRVADGLLLNTYPVSSGFIWTLDWHGDLIVCGGSEAAVEIWDVARGLLVQTLPAHGGWVNEVAFSPDGTRLATCGGDHTVRIWHVPSWRLAHTLRGHTDIVECLAWSPDGARLASAAIDQNVRFWEAASGSLTHTLPSPTSRLRSIAWKPDGMLLAGSAPGHPLHLWDTHSGALLHTQVGPSGFGKLAWHPNNRLLALTGADQMLYLWDAETRAIAHAAPHSEVSGSVAWSPCGTMLAVPYTNSTVRLWDGQIANTLAIYYGYTAWIYSVAWSPDGALVAGGTHDGRIQVWDPLTGRQVRALSGHEGWVLAVGWSADGTRLASGGSDGTVRLWEPASGRARGVVGLHAGVVETVSWSRHGMLASGGRDAVVRVWECGDRPPLCVLQGHEDIVLSVAWSPDGTLLASGGRDQTVRVWEVASGHERCRFTAHQDVVTSVAWSPDGARLASASNDDTVRVWRLDSTEEAQVLRGHTGQVKAVAWCPDGGMLASAGNDMTVRVWDSATFQCLRTLQGHTQWIKSVAWSPDGGQIVSGSYDETMRLWRSASGECVAVLRAPGPYAGMNIAGAAGLTEAQRKALITLGAVEELYSDGPRQ
jgi:WD40 repeat protein/DNA-binding SARP family transcriptional activator